MRFLCISTSHIAVAFISILSTGVAVSQEVNRSSRAANDSVISDAPALPASPKLAEALAALDARRARYRSVEISVTQTTHQDLLVMRRLRESKKRDAPPRVTNWKFWMDGIKNRYEAGDPSDPTIAHFAMSFAFDGHVSKAFFPSDPNPRGAAVPAGMIFKNLSGKAESQLLLRPVLWTFRGLSDGANKTDLSRLAEEPDGVIEGSECTILSYPKGPGIDYFWFDRAKEFSVVRYEQKAAGMTSIQLDCCYQKNEEGYWTPERWTARMPQPAGEPPALFECEVTSCIVNPQIEPSKFEIVFPPGTIVSDLRDDTVQTVE